MLTIQTLEYITAGSFWGKGLTYEDPVTSSNAASIVRHRGSCSLRKMKACSCQEVRIQVGTSTGSGGKIPIALYRLADPGKARYTERTVEDRDADNSIDSKLKQDFEW